MFSGDFFYHSTKIIVYWQDKVRDSVPESESTQFYRLQVRLRAKVRLTDSNSSIDSGYASLFFFLPTFALTLWTVINHRRVFFLNK